LGQGRIEDAREELLRFEQLCQVARRPVHSWYLMSTKTARAIWEGDFAAGEALAAEALEFGTRMEILLAHGYYGGQLFQLRRDQGRLEELLPLLQQQAAAYPTMAIWRAGLAVAYAETGDADAARAELDRAAHRDFDDLICDMNWLPVMTLFGSVSAILGDRRAADLIYSRLSPLRAGVVTTGAVTVALGIGEHTLGQLALVQGNARRAMDHFQAALQLTQRMGAFPWIARAQAGLFAALRQLGTPASRVEAREMARRARTTAERLGMATLAESLRQLVDTPPTGDRGSLKRSRRDHVRG
jgi:tetratricopeptide (TPR) repeat protein